MSALLAVCQPNAVHLLTDAFSANPDGSVAMFKLKQATLKNGTAVAGIGYSFVALEFARLADERTSSFDEMVEVAPELWAEARSILPSQLKDEVFPGVFAGWSNKHAGLRLHIMPHFVDTVAYIACPAPSSAELADTFVERFSAKPDTFDPHRDGVEYIEKLRSHHFRQYGQKMLSVVGGLITHTVVTRDTVTSEVIHHWPNDRVGQPLDLECSPGSRPLPAEVMEALKQKNPELAARHRTPGLPDVEEVAWLKRNPSRAHDFDADFWPGAARHYLHA